MLENVVLSWVPRPLTIAMIATEMPAAIRPYSIAVAPRRVFQKRCDLVITQLCPELALRKMFDSL
jgi:hypothetical protein